jgi:hypothetical protein
MNNNLHEPKSVESIQQIKHILADPNTDTQSKIAMLGYESLDTELGHLLTAIMYMHPDKYSEVINDIFAFGCSNDNESTTEQTVRKNRFAEDVRDRDMVCRITGRFAARCEVAHILEFKECVRIGDQVAKYDTENGLLIDAGLHQLWDSGVIQLVPLGPDRAQFMVNSAKYMGQALECDIPELAEPVVLSGLSNRMMDYIQRRLTFYLKC